MIPCRAAEPFVFECSVFLALSEIVVSHWVEQAFRPAVKAQKKAASAAEVPTFSRTHGSGADPSHRARKEHLRQEQFYGRGFGMMSREGEGRGGWMDWTAPFP